MAKLFVNDDGAVRRLRRLFFNDNGIIRELKTIHSDVSGVVQKIYDFHRYWRIEGNASSNYLPGAKEIVDFGIDTDFDAGQDDYAHFDLALENDFDSGGAKEVVDFGVPSNFTGGADVYQNFILGVPNDFNTGTPVTTQHYIDYTFSKTNLSGSITRVAIAPYDGASAQSFVGPSFSAVSFTNTAGMIDVFVDAYNNASNTYTAKWGTASRIGNTTLRILADSEEDWDLTSGDNVFGISMSGPAPLSNLSGTTLTVTSNAFTNSITDTTPISSGSLAAQWQIDNATLTGGTGKILGPLTKPTFFSIDFFDGDITDISERGFAANLNAAQTRSAIRTALENTDGFSDKWEYVKDTEIVQPDYYDIVFSGTFTSFNTPTTGTFRFLGGAGLIGDARIDFPGTSTTISDFEDFIDWFIPIGNSGTDLFGDDIGTFSKVNATTLRLTVPATAEDWGLNAQIGFTTFTGIDFTGVSATIKVPTWGGYEVNLEGENTAIRTLQGPFGNQSDPLSADAESSFATLRFPDQTGILFRAKTAGLKLFPLYRLRTDGNANVDNENDAVGCTAVGTEAGSFTLSNTSDSIPAITAKFDDNANATTARTNLKTALTADPEFNNAYSFETDTEVDSNTVARYRAKVYGNKSDFTFTVTNPDGNNSTAYDNVVTQGTNPASYSFSGGPFTTPLTGDYDTDNAGVASALATIKAALEGSTEFSNEYEFDTETTGINQSSSRWRAKTIGQKATVALANTANGGSNTVPTVTYLAQGEQKASFVISNPEHDIPNINGVFTDNANATQARTDIKNALDSDAEFSAAFEFVKDTDSGSGQLAARYRSLSDTDYEDFTFSITSNGGTNTTPYLNVAQDGALGDPATSVTVTMPDASVSISVNANADTAGNLIADNISAITYDTETDLLKTPAGTSITITNPNTLTITRTED